MPCFLPADLIWLGWGGGAQKLEIRQAAGEERTAGAAGGRVDGDPGVRLRREVGEPAGPGGGRRRPSLGARFQSSGSGSSAPSSLNLRGFAGSPGQG